MKGLLAGVVLLAIGSIVLSAFYPCRDWVHFGIYLILVLLSSGMRVRMPGGASSVSVNFPFILLTIVDGSPLQTLLIAGVSVLLQCLDRKRSKFTTEQIVFNVSNTVLSAVLAWFAYEQVFSLTGQIPPGLAAASLSYSVVNVVLIARMIGWASSKSMLTLLRGTFADYLPYYLISAFLATVVALISIRYGWLSGLLIFPVAWALYRSVTFYVEREEERKKYLEEMASVHLRTVEALAMAIEAKDPNTHDHLCRVRVYVEEIGREMDLSDTEMQALRAAALLHDIGKLAVPEHIITKPGKLTPEEFEKMKIHPAVGADILSRVGFSYPVVPIVRSHHERWDGKGYPDGLSGENIPIGARIISAVDCFDALASDRPYRPALPMEQAMEYVKKQAGKQFDPAVVTVLERRYPDLEARARAEGAKMQALNTSFVVARGEAPGAGFEFSGGGPASKDSIGKSHHPLASIAAASQEAQVLYQLGQMLGSSLSLNKTLMVLADNLLKLVPYDCFVMYLVEGECVVPAFVRGDHRIRFERRPIPLGEGLTGWVAQAAKPIINGNASVEPGVQNTPLRSALAVPLETATKAEGGYVFGVLALYSLGRENFTRDHLRILQAVTTKAARAIENSLHHHRVEYEAVTDFLTGILNARGFVAEAERKLSAATGGVALLACDLNGFKSVNDTEGHATGDQLLRAVAEVFQQVCGSDAVTARLGGDEFVALLPIVDEEKLKELSKAIIVAIEGASLQVLGKRNISASVGTAVLGQDGTSLDQLAAVADQRMYQMKRGSGEGPHLLQAVVVA